MPGRVRKEKHTDKEREKNSRGRGGEGDSKDGHAGPHVTMIVE